MNRSKLAEMIWLLGHLRPSNEKQVYSCVCVIQKSRWQFFSEFYRNRLDDLRWRRTCIKECTIFNLYYEHKSMNQYLDIFTDLKLFGTFGMLKALMSIPSHLTVNYYLSACFNHLARIINLKNCLLFNVWEQILVHTSIQGPMK